MRNWTMIGMVVLLSACGSNPHRIRIRGQFENLPQADLVLFSPDGGLMTIDTLHIQKGKFEYETFVEDVHETYTYTIVYPNYHTLSFQTHGGGNIRIAGDALSLSQVSVEGADSVLSEKPKETKRPLAIGRTIPKSNIIKPIPGAYQLIAFWASWKYGSDPSSYFRQALRNYTDSLHVFSYSLDVDPNNVRKVYDRDTLRWHVYCDYTGWGGDLLTKYGIRNIPYYLLTDPKGKILAMGSEYNRDVRPTLEKVRR